MSGLVRDAVEQEARDERLLDDMVIVARAASQGVPLKWLAATVVHRLKGGGWNDLA